MIHYTDADGKPRKVSKRFRGWEVKFGNRVAIFQNGQGKITFVPEDQLTNESLKELMTPMSKRL